MIFAGHVAAPILVQILEVPPLHEPPLRPPPRSRPRPRFLLLVSRTRTRTRTIGFMAPMRAKNGVRAADEPLVAADVSRRTCLVSRQRISAASRRRLRFRGSTHEIFFLELLPMNMSDRDRPVPTDRGNLPHRPVCRSYARASVVRRVNRPASHVSI